MKIFIPTRGRVGKQLTKSCLYLDQGCDYEVVFVVPECESQYWSGHNTMVVPDDYRMGKIRQYIMDNGGDDYQVVIDDDLKFFRRPDIDDPALLYATKNDIDEMLQRIEEYLDNYAHGAISPRGGNNHYLYKAKENTRAMRCLFYDAEILRAEDVRWDAIECRMDFHVSLSLIELGYPNIVDYEFAQGTPTTKKFQTNGGCAVYRTREMFENQAYELQRLHPVGVKVVKKLTKVAYEGHRTDVTCYWKKSYMIRSDERKLFRGDDNESN